MTTVVGYSMLSQVQNTYSAFFFITFEEWSKRKKPEEQYGAIKAELTRRLASISGAVGFAFPPPAIPGVGVSGGATFILQDRAGKDIEFLHENTTKFIEAARKRPELADQISASAARALDLFAGVERLTDIPVQSGGLQAISDFLERNVPAAEQARAGEVLVRILNGVLFELGQLAQEKAGLKAWVADETSQAFMTQAVLALSDLPVYPAPMAFALTDFTQVQASVFQVARAPGKNIVYLRI